MDLASLFVGAMLGFIIALAATLLSEVVKARRNLKASARILLDELDRLDRYFEDGGLKYSERRRARLSTALDNYRLAIFMADPLAFEEHLTIYREMVPAVESSEDIEREEFRILVSTRKRLRQLVKDDPSRAVE